MSEELKRKLEENNNRRIIDIEQLKKVILAMIFINILLVLLKGQGHL